MYFRACIILPYITGVSFVLPQRGSAIFMDGSSYMGISQEFSHRTPPAEVVEQEWRLSDVRSDLHVIHFARGDGIEFGDAGASMTIRQIVDFVWSEFPDGSIVVVGNHTPGFSEIVGTDSFVDVNGEFDHKGYLLRQKKELEAAIVCARARKDRLNPPHILFGTEADISISDSGEADLIPPIEVLADSEVGLDVVTASFHYERIPPNKQTGEYFYEGFKKAIESGVVLRLGHPIWELKVIRDYDPKKYYEILALANANNISFEINARRVDQLEYPPTAKIVEEMIANGCLLDFGVDFHNWRAWKRSNVIASAKQKEVQPDQVGLLDKFDIWQRFYMAFKDEENQLWNKILIDYINQEICVAGMHVKLKDVLWKVYKGKHLRFDQMIDTSARRKAFDGLCTEIVEQLPPPARELVRNKLAELYDLYTDRPSELTQEEAVELEQIFARTGFNLGDLKRVLKAAYLLKHRFGLPRTQFLNVLPIKAQLAFYTDGRQH